MSFFAKYFIARNIKHYFGFLLERGYAINEIYYDWRVYGNWRVVLQSSRCRIIIAQDRNEIFLSFASHGQENKEQFAIESAVYFISDEGTFIGFYGGNLFREKKMQFDRLAKLTNEFIDQIEPLFGNDYEKFKIELLMAQSKYNERLLKSIR